MIKNNIERIKNKNYTKMIIHFRKYLNSTPILIF